MNSIPVTPFETVATGDILTGQDGNKYVVCKEGNISFWKPYSNSKPKVSKKIRDKFHWKDNDKKQRFEGDYDRLLAMIKSLKPKVSPTKFPAGYVWTTKFNRITFVVDIEYKGDSKTTSRFWKDVYFYPPCLNANDYPFEYVSGVYYVDYDETGNKFWSHSNCDGEKYALEFAYKFPKGYVRTTRDGTTWTSNRLCDGSARWFITKPDNDNEVDRKEEQSHNIIYLYLTEMYKQLQKTQEWIKTKLTI